MKQQATTCVGRWVGALMVTGALALAAWAPAASAGSSDGNPSPIAGSSVSNDANRRADMAQSGPVEYANAAKKGPRIIVLPGEIKSSNASFAQRITANNIADFGELELTRANFIVLERSKLGPMLNEVELAYNMGDAAQARRLFQKGRLASTRWIVEFDILKAEPVASAGGGFTGNAVASLLNIFGGGSKAAQAGSVAANSVHTDQEAQVWNVGLRYKILDAATTEQVANGYFEDKMEAGATGTSVLGMDNHATGQLTLDSLVQRLVQKSVAEIDARYK
jgi:hypothetical protein